jgi:hypothetical protein
MSVLNKVFILSIISTIITIILSIFYSDSLFEWIIFIPEYVYNNYLVNFPDKLLVPLLISMVFLIPTAVYFILYSICFYLLKKLIGE